MATLKDVQSGRMDTMLKQRFEKALSALMTNPVSDGETGDNLRRVLSNPEHLKKEFANKLINDGFLEKAGIMLRVFTKELGILENSSITLDDRFEYLTSLLLTYSHWSKPFAKAMAQTTIVEEIAKFLKHKPFVEQFESSNATESLIRESLCLMGNMARYPETHSRLRQIDLAQLLKPFCKSNSKFIRLISVMDSASIATEAEVAQMDIASELPYMVQALEKSIKDDDHFFRDKTIAVSAEEIAEGIALVAVNDVNKEQLSQLGVLVPLASLLYEGNEAEQATAGKALWNLLLTKSAREAAQNIKAIRESASSLKATTASDSVRSVTEGLMWTLYTEDEREEQLLSTRMLKTMPGKQSATHEVFVSYSTSDTEVVHQLCTHIKKSGLSVRDLAADADGSSITDSADAIQQAQVAIVCLSESYKCSPSCRSEAEYIKDKHTPFLVTCVQPHFNPGGWVLQIPVANRVYNIGRTVDLQRDISHIISHINRLRKPSGPTDNIVAERTPGGQEENESRRTTGIGELTRAHSPETSSTSNELRPRRHSPCSTNEIRPMKCPISLSNEIRPSGSPATTNEIKRAK